MSFHFLQRAMTCGMYVMIERIELKLECREGRSGDGLFFLCVLRHKGMPR